MAGRGFVPVKDIRKVVATTPAVRRQLESTAEKIARDTTALARDRLYKAHAAISRGQVRVLTKYPFAHLDEFGSVNNPPTGAMRRAASRHARLRVSPKQITEASE